MSVSLRLLPYYMQGEGSNFSGEILNVRYQEDQDELFARIQALPQIEVDAGFASYKGRNEEGEECFGETLETPYCEPLTYTKAVHLKTCGIEGAAGAYVQALRDDHKIALYWC